jgi:hypothetical protein
MVEKINQAYTKGEVKQRFTYVYIMFAGGGGI